MADDTPTQAADPVDTRAEIAANLVAILKHALPYERELILDIVRATLGIRAPRPTSFLGF
jgi:hypothetical protein